MIALIHGMVPLVVAAGLLSAGVCLAVTRRLPLSLGVLLDFLIAAGLLRLAGDPSWREIVLTAILIAVRKLAAVGLRTATAEQRRSTPEEHHTA